MIEPKKILLINPPSGFLLDQKVFLPLGIAYVAAVARQKGHQVELLDLADSDNYVEESVKASERNDIVGITATSPQFYYAHRILKGIKAKNKNKKVIIGGSHASMFSSLRKAILAKNASYNIYDEDINFIKLEDFDVIAEGEEYSLQIAIDSNQKWVNGGITTELDKLPFPARDLFDFNKYLFDPQGSPKFKIGGKPSGSIISQRGCPYFCEFCCGRDTEMYHLVKLPGGFLRCPSPERILQELTEMRDKYGLESFMFYDDEFNLDPKRTIALCKVLDGKGFSFRGFVKGDLLVRNPEIATYMKNAGFNEVLSGIESGSDRILKDHLHKRTSPTLNYQAAQICLEAGIDFKALTLLGHTSETPKDIMDTRDWLLKTGKMYKDKVGDGHFTFDITVFQPYAGCPIWDRAQKNKGLFKDEFSWAYHSKVDDGNGGLYFNKVDFSEEHGFYKGVPGQYKAFIRTKHVSSEQFAYLRDSIEWDVRDRLNMPQLSKLTVHEDFEKSMGQ